MGDVMDEGMEIDCSIRDEDIKKSVSINLYIILVGICVLIIGLTYLGKCGLFDRSAKNIYTDLKDYQTCKVITEENKFKETINALVCELSPVQQKTPETVQLSQKKVVELSEEIKRYNSETIKQLNALLDDDFVKKNPERAIDNIIAEMKRFDLCLVVSSEDKMAVDCSLKEKDRNYFLYGVSEVEKVNEYYQKQSKINHKLDLIDNKYFNYFKDERNKEIKEVKDNSDLISEALRQKAKMILEYENLLIEKKTKEIQKEIKKK
jgi:hypothetical protein